MKEDRNGIEGPTEKLNIVIYDSAEPGGYAELKAHFSYGTYHDEGVQTSDEEPILLQISLQEGVDEAFVPRGEKVTLYMANGSSINVFLPALKFDRNQTPSITEYKLWVAEDGSTYWAGNPETGLAGTEVKKSGLYAAKYDPGTLACCAYDARLYRYASKSMAQSPAIDRGTDDAYGYDSTSTNPKVIDMSQPDIGYHYYRRVADDDPVDNPNTTEVEESDQTVEITFRQPDVAGIGGYSVSKRFNGMVSLIDNYPADTSPHVKDKEVVLIPFYNQFEYGKQQILVETVVGSKKSTPAEVNLIVDPFAPEVEIGQ